MAGIVVFLYPERIGLARIHASGCITAPTWRSTENMPGLLDEPVMLASLVREMAGDNAPYDLSVCLYPGIYSQIMFSHSDQKKRDLMRLRRAELETVLRRECEELYTYDLHLTKPAASPAAKDRRLIFAIPREWVKLTKAAFSARGMKLRRLVPMDVVAAESALRYWAPADRTISLCLTLDEACTSAALLQGGHIMAMRTSPGGLGTAMKLCCTAVGAGPEICRKLVCANGIYEAADDPGYTAVADAMLRTISQLAADAVKMLHATFGSEARLDQVLLCGSLAQAAGVKTYFDTVLEANCILAGENMLRDTEENTIFLQENDTAQMFALAAAATTEVDLLQQMKSARRDRVSSATICALLGAACIALMAVTPLSIFLIHREKQALETLLSQPEYAIVEQLLQERNELLRHKAALEEAVEALPHGQTDAAGIAEELLELSGTYGTVRSVRIDYAGQIIVLDFSAPSYDAFLYWQKALSDSGRFRLLEAPAFTASGSAYTVSAKLTAADFAAEREGTA